MSKLYEFDHSGYFVEYVDKLYNVIKNYKTDKYMKSINILAHYDEMVNILEDFIVLGYRIHSVSLTPPDWDGYDDEYLLELYDDMIFVEKAKRDGKYLYSEGYVRFCYKDTNKEYLESNENCIVFYFDMFNEKPDELGDFKVSKDEKSVEYTKNYGDYKVSAKYSSNEKLTDKEVNTFVKFWL